MKYLIIASDLILDDIKERYPYIEEKPIVRPLFIDENGNSVYLSKSEVDALLHAAQYEAFEHIKKRHEQGIFDILKEAKKGTE